MPRVLYIEDEEFLARIVKESLESRNFEIIHAKDGIVGLAYFKKFNPEICVLDVMLPGKDGFELAKEIRALDEKVPIIFLTAKGQQKDIISGFDHGGNDYLTKPFSMEELIVRINNLLKLTGAETHKKEYIILGKFQYSGEKMHLLVEGKTILLSHKENTILKMLVSNENKKLERADLLNHVWGNDSFFNSRTLDVYIRKLRSIFEIDSRINIVTLRGVGYTFYIDK